MSLFTEGKLFNIANAESGGGGGAVESVNGHTGVVVLDAEDVGALADTTKYVASASWTIDSSTYVMTLQLKDQDGENIGTAQTIDLPLESVVVGGSYDSANKKIVLTLNNGTTIDVPVADLVSGLQSEITAQDPLSADLVDDTNTTHKFVSAAEKSTWNGKQDAISDLATIRSGAAAGATAVQPAAIADMETQTHASATYATKAELVDKQDIMQYSTMPTASADNVDDIVQFVGTTDSTYTNGYFYKCTESSGSYSWVQTDVQPSSGGSSYTAGTGINITNDVISTSNYVVVNGSRYNVEGVDSVAISYNYTGATRARAVGSHSFAVCNNSYATDTGSLAIGYETKSQGYATIAMGVYSEATQRNCIAVGAIAKATADYAIQIGGFGKTNNDANTVKFANANGNYEIMSADGTIPEARLADTTSAAQGQVLTLDTNLNAVWETPSGGSSLPDMTGQSGKFLTTDGSAASWSDKPLVNNHTGTMALSIYGTNTASTGNRTVAVGFDSSAYYSGTAIGYRALSSGIQCIAIGYTSSCGGERSIAIGYNSQVTAQEAYQLGYGVNSERGTFYVGMSPDNGATWQNHKLLDKDGTIPEARFAATTNATAGQVLTLDSNLVATWATPSGGGAGAPTLTWYTVSTAGNTLTIADTSSAQLVKVYKNGLLLQPTEDYSISGTTLTTVTALVVGDKITTEVF